MKIAIVSPRGFVQGGISRVVESWARVIGAAGHAVVVLTPEEEGAIPFPTLECVGRRA